MSTGRVSWVRDRLRRRWRGQCASCGRRRLSVQFLAILGSPRAAASMVSGRDRLRFLAATDPSTFILGVGSKWCSQPYMLNPTWLRRRFRTTAPTRRATPVLGRRAAPPGMATTDSLAMRQGPPSEATTSPVLLAPPYRLRHRSPPAEHNTDRNADEGAAPASALACHAHDRTCPHVNRCSPAQHGLSIGGSTR